MKRLLKWLSLTCGILLTLLVGCFVWTLITFPIPLRMHFFPVSSWKKDIVCSDPGCRWDAIVAVYRRPASERREAMGEILTALSDADPAIRRVAVLSLYLPGQGERIVPPVIRSLLDENTSVVASACVVLGQFGAEARAAIAELSRLLTNADVRIRTEAELSLSKIRAAGEHE